MFYLFLAIVNESVKELEKIGARLKELRLKKGFSSARKFAGECEMEARIYWRIEHGKSDFKYTTLKRILKVLNLSVSEFYQDLQFDKE